MSSSFGTVLKLQLFGESHGPAVGMCLDGFPAGFQLDPEALQTFLDRRAPGRSALTSTRREADRPEFLSGLADGLTCGAPLTAVLPNGDAHPADYAGLEDTPRPSHADYPAAVKYHGAQAASGGGHFSGRLTAPLCVAGGLCLQLLAAQGVEIFAHIAQIGSIPDRAFDPLAPERPGSGFPVLDAAAGVAMRAEITAAAAAGDSVGGVVECAVTGLPAGVGAPMFDGLENRLAQALFAIPAVKGVEFGSGFAGAALRGSENNDPYYMENGAVRTRTNHAGGILGGITTGMPLLFRIAVKPTPSIGQAQQTVDLAEKKDAALTIRGRHDPCIVPRAIPVAEACAAIALLDLLR